MDYLNWCIYYVYCVYCVGDGDDDDGDDDGMNVNDEIGSDEKNDVNDASYWNDENVISISISILNELYVMLVVLDTVDIDLHAVDDALYIDKQNSISLILEIKTV